MSTDIVGLLRQGRTDEIWNRYCGFLDLSLEEFMQVQKRLLNEQIERVGRSTLGQHILGQAVSTIDDFRIKAPLTTYADYEPYLGERSDDALAMKPHIWAHTSGRSGRYKMVPFSREMFDRAGERIMTAVILAMAHERGEVRLEERDVLLYNTPPHPYASGISLLSLSEHFPFHFVPSLEQTKSMSFQERMELSFQTAMITGIDVLGSITSVLIKIGERFASGGGSARLSRQMLHPKAMWRVGKALVRSRMAGRALLPKDLWTVKGILCGGTDTTLFKKRIEDYWGVIPHEIYASTEAGVITALQAWDRKGLYFLPDVAFLEFIPEAEWMRERQEPAFKPSTVMLDEVRPGQRYELVITSLGGGPFLRYRMGDLVRFLGLHDPDTGIRLPSMTIAGRADGLIDIASFTGLMDEPMFWGAIHSTGLAYEDWTVRKEVDARGPFIHLYIELKEALPVEQARSKIHEQLKLANPFYADLESMLEVNPLRLTLLKPGAFRAYALEKQAQGADLGHLKPAHMNVSDATIATLLRLSASIP
jgi:hypothetical protein